MRINDGSICSDYKHFEHECDLGNGCTEQCEHNDKQVREVLVNDYEKVVTECIGYKSR